MKLSTPRPSKDPQLNRTNILFTALYVTMISVKVGAQGTVGR